MSGTNPRSVSVEQMLEPLAQFYRAAAQPLPLVTALETEGVPEPYRGLLVHADDMTSTLEKHYGERVHLRVLQHQETDGVLYREVVLVGDDDGQPTEFGAIRIHLRRFPEAARVLIQAGHLPLGRILADEEIEYVCRPQRFFRWQGDVLTSKVFEIEGEHQLYGRHNVLVQPAGGVLAEAVEILPPIGG